MRGPRVMPELPFALKSEPYMEGGSQTNLCFLCSTAPSSPPHRNAKEQGCCTADLCS
jgi:hypothetical protein